MAAHLLCAHNIAEAEAKAAPWAVESIYNSKFLPGSSGDSDK